MSTENKAELNYSRKRNTPLQIYEPVENLTTSTKPYIIFIKIVGIDPPEVITLEGESTSFRCNIQGRRVTWLFNGHSIPNNNKQILTLPKITKDMEGEYRCNAEGKTKKGKASLWVRGKLNH